MYAVIYVRDTDRPTDQGTFVAITTENGVTVWNSKWTADGGPRDCFVSD